MGPLIIEIIGWVGAGLLLLAYFLLTHKDLSARSKIYQGMNVVGSILLGLNAFVNTAYPSFTMNAIWMIIALYGFYHIFKLRKR